MAGLTFGQRSEDYVPQTIDPDDIWLKTIKVGETKVRFLEPTGKWVTYREHYDPDVRKSFPCTEDMTCKGCSGSNERVRSKSRKYAFNALDSQGRLNVYKIGVKFRDQLVSREKRAETLLDRDYLLIREGTTMENTLYSYEPGDKSSLDFDEDLHDIGKILFNQYLQYLEVLGEDEPADNRSHDEEVKPKKAKADEAQNTTQEDILPLEDWPLSRMKALLDNEEIEFPLRASKATLIPMIEEWSTTNNTKAKSYGLPPF